MSLNCAEQWFWPVGTASAEKTLPCHATVPPCKIHRASRVCEVEYVCIWFQAFCFANRSAGIVNVASNISGRETGSAYKYMDQIAEHTSRVAGLAGPQTAEMGKHANMERVNKRDAPTILTGSTKNWKTPNARPVRSEIGGEYEWKENKNEKNQKLSIFILNK